MQLCWNFHVFHNAAFLGYGRWRQIKRNKNNPEARALPRGWQRGRVECWERVFLGITDRSNLSPETEHPRVRVQTTLLASRGGEEGLSQPHAKTPPLLCAQSAAGLDRCVGTAVAWKVKEEAQSVPVGSHLVCGKVQKVRRGYVLFISDYVSTLHFYSTLRFLPLTVAKITWD